MSKKSLSNLYIKILAIAFATLLWIFVINQGFKIDFLEKEIPIQAHNLSEDLSLNSDLGKVKLKIRAPKSFWQKYSDDSIQAYVDLKYFSKGVYNIDVKISALDPQVQVIEKDPSKINVVIDSISSVKKNIEIKTEGNLAQDYSTKDPYSEPSEIEIKGGRTILDKIDKVVAKIKLNGESAEIKQNITPQVLDKEGKIISNIITEPKEIKVVIPVQKQIEIKTVGVKSKVKGNPAQGYAIDEIKIEPSTVTIQGKSEELENVNYLETEEIDINGAKENKEEKVKLVFPTKINPVDIKEVTVKVSVSSSIKTQNLEAQISFINLSDNLEIVSYTPKTISIDLEGETDALSTVKNNPPKININLKDKTRGTHTFSIDESMITLPENITLKSIGTKEVKVGLEEKQ